MSEADPKAWSEAIWRDRLSPEAYRVLRQAGTERPFGPSYAAFKKEGQGLYTCRGCGQVLFSSATKFDAHCGWPAFYDPSNLQSVTLHADDSLGSRRVEVRCARCDGHLGHVFSGEGFPTPTDQRYCINAIALKFTPAESGAEDRP